MSRVHRLPGRYFGGLTVLAVVCVALLMPAARAGDMLPAAAAPEAPGWSILDGQEFSGQFGALGKDAKGSDSWVFQAGMFLSKSCLECGFPETPYLVRFEPGKILFEAETQCPVSDATIVWRGTVEDGTIEGVFTWVKKRWYWTIEKDFWFKGTLAEPPSARAAELN